MRWRPKTQRLQEEAKSFLRLLRAETQEAKDLFLQAHLVDTDAPAAYLTPFRTRS